MTTALILIDIQNDYFPGGAMELVGCAAAAQQARTLLDAFRERQLPVFHVRHIAARPGSTFFLPDTAGAEIHELVAPQPGEMVLVKHFPNSFRDTGLLLALEESSVDNLVICGMMTLMCVDATVRAAFDFGLSCTVAGDACATKALLFNGDEIPAKEVHGAFLAALGGVYAQVSTVREVLAG